MLSAPPGPFLGARRTFSLFLRYRARLPRPHPGGGFLVACSKARGAGVSAEVCQTGKTSTCMPAYYCRFKRRKWAHLLSDGGEKYGLAEWRNWRRRARLLLHAQLEGPPKTREEEVLDAGRIRLILEKLQAFYARGYHEDILSGGRGFCKSNL